MAKQTDVKLLRNGVRGQLVQPAVRDTLRDKQIEAFEALISPNFSDEQISHSYFKLPTGFGKTVMFSHMARAYFDAVRATGATRQKIIIIVPRLSLIEQTQQKLAQFADITATEFSGRQKDAKSDVIITTYNSLTKLFGVVDFNDVGLIFADEAHHMLGGKISEQLEFYNKFVPIIGFTATPEYEANRTVANLLNTEIYAMGIPDAVRSGVLNPVKNVLYRSSIVCDLANVPSRTNGDFDFDNITTKISPETLATEIAQIYANGVDENTGIEFRNLRAIVNCPNTKIAEIQAAKINEVMGRNVAIALHKEGISDKKFDRLQKDFVSGKYSVACQVNTLTEGFDDVTVAMCINYPTRSRVRAEQAAGRAIRIDENNPDKIAFVVDTIFRATADEKSEDILYTASNSKQVLFKDIAGDMVLYPDNFRVKRAGNHGPRNRGAVEFVDFALITDTTILVDLQRQAAERIAAENIPIKTDNWFSIKQLTEKLQKSKSAILKWIKEYKAMHPDDVQEMRGANGKPLLVLLASKYDDFEKFIGILPVKDDNWFGKKQLMEKLQKSDPTILKFLRKYKAMHPDDVQEMRGADGKPALVLLASKYDDFEKFIGILPVKDDNWFSVKQLAAKLQKSNSAILKWIKEYKAMHPDDVQEMRGANGISIVCLLASKYGDFEKFIGILPVKDDNWFSVTQLMEKLQKSNPTIINWLREYKAMHPDDVQEMVGGGGRVTLCLLASKYDDFANFFGGFDVNNWLSVEQLMEKLQKSNHTILKWLKEYKAMHPDDVQKIRGANGRPILCLLASKYGDFEKFIGILPAKVNNWFSVTQLAAKLQKSNSAIWRSLKKYKAEHPDAFQEMRGDGGQVTLYLRASKYDDFANFFGGFDVNNWLSVEQLMEKLQKSNLTILKWLKEYKAMHPDDVQKIRGANGRPILCLLASKYDDFANSFGGFDVNNWFSVKQLVEKLQKSNTTILKWLKEYKAMHPDDVQEMRDYNGCTTWCLLASRYDDFDKFVGQEKQSKKGSLKRGATVLDATVHVTDTATAIKSTTTDKIKKK